MEEMSRQSSASRTTRTLKVDLDWLRKQSIITPNSVRTPVAEGFRRKCGAVRLDRKSLESGVIPVHPEELDFE